MSKLRILERMAGAVGFACLFVGFITALTPAQATTSVERAHAIGVDAYTYLYSLVTMDVTRKQLTNAPVDLPGLAAPPNVFRNVPAYPTADMRVVVRPNFDTLYSSAWLDLTKGPVVVSVPDTQGRYYLLPMLDMWTDVFASPGWRTTGTGAQKLRRGSAGWAGGLGSLPGRRRSRRRRRSYGSSAASRPTDLRTTKPFTGFRPA